MSKEIDTEVMEDEDEGYVEALGDPGDDVAVPEGALVPTDKSANGRVTAYNSAAAEIVLMKIADGATLREIAKMPGMPTKSTIQRWIMKYPELSTAWKAARELSASALEDEALDMARVLKKQSGFTGTKVRAFEVAMNQFRWSASHRDPATFGQTAQPNLVVPIQINTSLDLGDGKGSGEAKTLGASTTYEVAAKYGEAYNGDHATLEGTDYTVEQGDGRKVTEVQADLPDDEGLVPKFDLRKSAVATKPRGKPGRPRKGHKSPADTARTAARYARRMKNKEKSL